MRRSARRTWSAFRIRRAARTSPPSWSRSRPSPPTSSWPTAAPGSRATRSRATSGSGARTSCPRRRAARWTSPRCAPRRRAWSEPPATLPDLRQHGGRERHVGACGVVAHEERVGNARRVVALGGQRELPLLQGTGHVHLAHQADEGGAGVGRQVPLGVRVERRAVEAGALGQDEGGHAGAAVLARHRHAVHVRLRHPGGAGEQVGDLLRGDVLALPAEGVADAIDEVVVAIGVLAQQVPGAEPGVAAREGVAHELPLARRAVGVAVVLHGAADLAEELARLARRACDAEAVRTAYERAAGEVEAREPDGVLEQRVRLADGADASVGVVQGHVALRRAVHLDDACDAEALPEGCPDVGAEAGARGDAQAVVAVARCGWEAEEVAAELAHVDEGDRLVPADVVEECARAETPARCEGAARAEGGREAHEEALAVVERQRRVDGLARLDAQEPGQRDPAQGEAEVAHDGRLRVPGRPGRVYIDEDVAAPEVGNPGLGRLGACAPLLERADIAGQPRARRRIGKEPDDMAAGYR